MRKIFLMAALIAGFAAAGSLLPSQANAMAISTPAAAQHALGEGNGILEQVRYVCRRVRRCGYRGCYTTRRCFNRPNYYYGGYGYRSYPRYYGYRNHYRRGWYY